MLITESVYLLVLIAYILSSLDDSYRNDLQLYILENCIRLVLDIYHASLPFLHLAIIKTYNTPRKQFRIPDLCSQVLTLVCQEWQMYRKSKPVYHELTEGIPQNFVRLMVTNVITWTFW